MKKQLVGMCLTLGFCLMASLAFGADAPPAPGQHIAVKVADEKGLPVKDAQVVAILKSGAYQDAKLDAADGCFKCEPTEQCVKIYSAAPGFEAGCTKYSGAAGVTAVALRQSAGKSSAIVRKRGALPGIDGDVSPILDSSKRTVIYATRIGLEERGRPVQQPYHFQVNRPIEATTSTGQKFKIYVCDITQEVSLLEFTQPK